MHRAIRIWQRGLHPPVSCHALDLQPTGRPSRVEFAQLQREAVDLDWITYMEVHHPQPDSLAFSNWLTYDEAGDQPPPATWNRLARMLPYRQMLAASVLVDGGVKVDQICVTVMDGLNKGALRRTNLLCRL